MKDIKFDPLTNNFYFYSNYEKSAYCYDVQTGRVDSVASNINGFKNNKSTGRILAVDDTSFVFIKTKPTEFTITSSDGDRKVKVQICTEY